MKSDYKLILIQTTKSSAPLTFGVQNIMRRIEENMLYAVRNGRNFRNGNTEVKVTKEEGEQITRVLLHSNCIFEQVQNMSGLYEKYFNLCGWNTPTTRSRLNGKVISSRQWYTVY